MTFHIRFIKNVEIEIAWASEVQNVGECSLCGCILIKITHVGRTLMILIFDGETSSKSMLLLM